MASYGGAGSAQRTRLHHDAASTSPPPPLPLALATLGKVKVKFTLEQAMKAQKGSRDITTLSLTSALDGVGWLTPRPGRFTPGNDPVPVVQEAG
jgi:hypothetical protein